MEAEFRSLRFCSHCGQWVDALTEHNCPRLIDRQVAVARGRLERWLGDFTIHQYEPD